MRYLRTYGSVGGLGGNAQVYPARARISLEKEDANELNIRGETFSATQWVANPTRQRLATSRKRVLPVVRV
jgi:hypothetical protein